MSRRRDTLKEIPGVGKKKMKVPEGTSLEVSGRN